MEALNILIVEDDVLTAADIRKTLERTGHRVTASARTFQEAVMAARNERPDLLLLDIHLNGSQDGVAVAGEILKQYQIPIVVLTANTEDETYKRVKETFVPAAYITKPFRHLDLTRVIDLAWHNFRPDAMPEISAVADSVFLPVDKGFQKIIKSEVTYIATKKSTHSVNVYEVYKKEPLLINLSMGHLEQYFGLPHFFRLSRSLMVNLNYIERIEGAQLKIQETGILLTIPEAARTDLMRKLAIVRGPRK
ncbi:response regulator [Dyadobacter sp. LHD-138]|uniref:response regulator n=1 Tax=Dyadobacter sp. LHD-138 TaxID=3071413 RepID=UPI0027E1A28E|nr:response regulator [Dyadobacter sp. LHD-138]MDQ6481915.1 response regulator [Dyadobacter sp. LHD-138]